jgi:class 3 adenylate cyclase
MRPQSLRLRAFLDFLLDRLTQLCDGRIQSIQQLQQIASSPAGLRTNVQRGVTLTLHLVQKTGQLTVTVVDIRSSTSILEDLKQTDNLHRWRNLLISLKQFLLDRKATLNLETYKFLGDGWIVLCPISTSKAEFTEFLTSFSAEFDSSFEDSIANFLQHRPERIGLTFGIDSGDLVRLEMNKQTEYLGRAINVAARLQNAAKGIGNSANYQALFSNNSFHAMTSPYDHQIPIRTVQVSLRNVANGERYECLEYRPL